MFVFFDFNDEEVGFILIIVVLLFIVLCLFVVVKLLNFFFKGMMVLIVKCFINVDFLGKFGWFIGYVVIFIGVGDICL